MTDHLAIRAVIAAWTEALHGRDAAAVMACQSADFVAFSLAPPLRADPAGPFGLEAWLQTWEGPLHYDLRDLSITAGEQVAFAHALVNMRGTKTGGYETDLWFRITLGFTRTGGDWRIVHEHDSVPFYMDAEMRAAVDLKP